MSGTKPDSEATRGNLLFPKVVFKVNFGHFGPLRLLLQSMVY